MSADAYGAAVDAAAAAISEHFGEVIGANQARNIAYIAVVAARAALRTERAAESVSRQGSAMRANLAGRFNVS